MTKFTLKNGQLVPVMNMLYTLNISGADSRSRTKLINILKKAYDGAVESENDLISQYCEVDQNGKTIKDEQGNPVPKEGKASEFTAERQKLFGEEVLIEGGMYSQNIDTLPSILLKVKDPLSGVDAEMYDLLLDKFEEANKRAKSNKPSTSRRPKPKRR